MNRKEFLKITGSAVAWSVASSFVPHFSPVQPGSIHTKTIPSSGEQIPAIGMGTWITFNVGNSTSLRDHRTKILTTFFEMGGGMIDSSPMYGSSEAVVGYGLEKLGYPEGLFSGTKVWTGDTSEGPEQIQNSMDLWGLSAFDLLQVHNLVNWQDHLKTLRSYKDQGLIKYIGVTTSHGRRHGELERIMKSEPLDFVQLTYNIEDRAAEERLLPLAQDKGIAVIANRPFQRKELIHKYEDHPLPEWAPELDINNWAQFFLKFIISHPALTVAIPATTQIPHMKENMGALTGKLPDQNQRQEMVRYIESL
jgi:diketogulonate reductase-like aldo/keto reductase